MSLGRYVARYWHTPSLSRYVARVFTLWTVIDLKQLVIVYYQLNYVICNLSIIQPGSFQSCNQCYEHFTIVIYDSTLKLTKKLAKERL